MSGADSNHPASPIAYTPFEGIVLTDTFQLFESTGHIAENALPENTARVRRQKAAPIRVVLSNPPYSAQQESENDNNANLDYPALDDRIRSTYAARSNAKLLKNLYDSYIRAIRWASDRIEGRGVVAFVTNGSFIDANNMDGLRACLVDEFTSLHVFNLRGNQRTSGELSRQEGGKIFGAGTRTRVAITVMVKNPAKTGPAVLRYRDIGDYLSREEKLALVSEAAGIGGIARTGGWQILAPNADHDWINQRDPAFESFIPLGDKEGSSPLVVFDLYSQGLLTSRDSWCYNASRRAVAANMRRMAETYTDDLPRVEKALRGVKKEDRERVVAETITTDAKAISWSGNLKDDVGKGKPRAFIPAAVVTGTYRPYVKQWGYFDRAFNERVYQLPQVFPEGRLPNVAICVDSRGSTKDFSALIVDTLPDYECISKGQCFPLYAYAPADEAAELDFGEAETINGYRRRDAITDAALARFRAAYGPKVTKEDIFYSVYGLLHSPEYRARFASNLKKELPRIPLTRDAADFQRFSAAGRALAQWHLNYETIDPYPLTVYCDVLAMEPDKLYTVQKMTYACPTPEQKAAGAKWDKTRILYNSHITLSGIPPEALDYIVNGKPALEWVLERYQVTVDKDSGIRNDPNDWAREHKDPRYILDLVKRVVRVSVETVKIVKSLPALNERTGK